MYHFTTAVRDYLTALLSARKDLQFQVADSAIRFTVPEVGEYEVAAITLAR